MNTNDLNFLELPVDQLDKEAAEFEQKYNQLQEDIGKKSSSATNANVYNSLIDTATEQRKGAVQRRSIYQEQMETAERKYGGQNNEAWKNAKSNYDNADEAVRKYTASLVTLREELDKLPEAQAQADISYNDSKRTAESSSLELRKTMGEILNPDDYEALLGIDEDNIKLQERLLQVYKDQLEVLTQRYDHRSNMTKEEENEFKATQANVNNQQAVVDQARGSQYTDEQEAALAKTNVFTSKLEELGIIYKEYTAEYENWIAKGGEMSDQQYRNMSTSIATQKTWLTGLKGVYENLAEEFGDDPAFKARMDQLAQDAQEQLDNLDATQMKIDVEYDGRELNHLRQDLVLLGRDGEDLKKKLDATDSITEKANILNQIIDNNDQQVNNLRTTLFIMLNMLMQILMQK